MTWRQRLGRLLAWVHRAGADDPVFDYLLLVAPALIALIALLGDHLLTRVLVAAYLLAFVGYTIYNGLTTSERISTVRFP